ncbi:MAG: hypothetical protein M3280_03865 [Actinomycetota bacterium]|nr:hypothetical protein [Actinomycetota bacterium]
MTDSDQDDRISISKKVNRRAFIVGASALAVSVKLTGPGLAQTGDEATGAQTQALSIGYVTGSDRMPDLSSPSWGGDEEVRVVPAWRARGERLTGRIRVTVHGLYPTRAIEWLGDRSVMTDVLVRDAKTGAKLPIFLWTHRAVPVTSTAAPAGLKLPSRRGFQLLLRVGDGSGEDYVAAADFGTDGLKPRRGVYLLGLGPSSWARSATFQDGQLPARRSSVVMTLTEAMEG